MDFKNFLFIKNATEGVMLSIKVSTAAKVNKLMGVILVDKTTYLKIQIHEKAVDGKANEELIAFLSEIFSIAKSNIIIKKGIQSSYKSILIKNFNEDQIKHSLYGYK